MIRRPPRSTLFPTRRSSDLEVLQKIKETKSTEKIVKPKPIVKPTTMRQKSKPTKKDIMGNVKFNNGRSEEHTSELQSRPHLVCRLLLEKKKNKKKNKKKKIN